MAWYRFTVCLFCFLWKSCKMEKRCSPPIPILYGSYKPIRDVYLENDLVTYSCNENAYLFGDKVRCCNNGQWNNTAPLCVMSGLKSILNKDEKEQFNLLVDGNYSSCLSLKNYEIRFKYNGTDEKIIVRIIHQNSNKNSLFPNTVKNGENICTSLKDKNVNSSSMVEYICTVEPTSINKLSIYSNNNQKICEVEVFYKKSSSCLPLPKVLNGTIIYNNRKENSICYGSAAIYNCSTGYIPQKEDVRFCSDDGKWTGSETKCAIVNCSSIEEVQNGRIEYTPSRAYQGIAKIQCKEGYTHTKNRETTCQSNGKWGEYKFECKLIHCENIANVQHGKIKYTNQTHHGIATLECNERYRSENGKPEAICLQNGSWSFVANFECKEIHCHPILANSDTPGTEWIILSAEKKHIPIGKEARINCSPNYTLYGTPVVIKCLKNGNWSKTTAKCKRIETVNTATIVIAAVIGATSSAVIFGGIICFLILKKRCLQSRQSSEVSQRTNSFESNVIPLDRHIYCTVSDEDTIKLKKPTSPLPKIPPSEAEFEYSVPIDQKKDSKNASQYIYTEPEDSYKLVSTVEPRKEIKRRNSSADSNYWRESSDDFKYISNLDTPVFKIRKISSNGSLPALKATLLDNDLYSSD